MTEKIEIVGSDKIDKPTKYIALVTPDYTTNKDVSWSVNDETIAKIDEDGTLTPIMNGAVIITAFAKDGSEVFATYEVDVIAYAKVDSIRLAGEWDKEFSPDTYEYNIYVNKDVDSLTLTTEYKNGTLFLDDVLLLSNTEHKVELINTTTVITLKRGNVSQLTNSEYRINIIKFEGTKTTVSEDKKYFTVKPVNMTAEKGGVVILALYRNGKCIEMQNKAYTDENLDSDGNISFTATTDYTGAKVMVWENLISMKPVCPAETVK